MKIYQLDDRLKRIYYDFNIKGVKTLEELVKFISKNRDALKVYDYRLNSYSVFVESIPKKISDYKELTIILDEENRSIRYFSSLCA